MEEDEFDDIFLDALLNSRTEEEKLRTLAFGAGVDLETVVRRVASNAPEEVVRFALIGILLGMLDAERPDMVMRVFNSMASLANDLGYEPED